MNTFIAKQEENLAVYREVYRDVHGIRPSADSYAMFRAMPLKEQHEELERLYEAADREAKRIEALQAESLQRFKDALDTMRALRAAKQSEKLAALARYQTIGSPLPPQNEISNFDLVNAVLKGMGMQHASFQDIEHAEWKLNIKFGEIEKIRNS